MLGAGFISKLYTATLHSGLSSDLVQVVILDHFLIKEQVMPDGKTKLILREKASGKIIQ